MYIYINDIWYIRNSNFTNFVEVGIPVTIILELFVAGTVAKIWNAEKYDNYILLM
jgi:hypothetical protein